MLRWAFADKKAFDDPIISKSWEKFCPNNFSMIELQARNMDYGIFIPAFLSSRLCADSPFLMEIIQIPPVVQHQASRRQGGTSHCIIMWQCNVRKLVASLQLWSRYLRHRMCQMLKIRCPRGNEYWKINRKQLSGNCTKTVKQHFSRRCRESRRCYR